MIIAALLCSGGCSGARDRPPAKDLFNGHLECLNSSRDRTDRIGIQLVAVNGRVTKATLELWCLEQWDSRPLPPELKRSAEQGDARRRCDQQDLDTFHQIGSWLRSGATIAPQDDNIYRISTPRGEVADFERDIGTR